MAGYQFIHVISYSGARPLARNAKGKGVGTGARKFSAADILAEADRDPKACKHVAEPLVPKWFIGSRALIEAAGKKWLDVLVLEKIPADARSDSAWLAAGVVSLPAERLADWPAFRDASIDYLKQKYGERLLGVVEHLDEPNPHLHFYAVPLPGQSFGVIHEGWDAKKIARLSGDPHPKKAFDRVMQAFQDAFYVAIGRPFGLTRFGPKRERLSRADWRLAQAEAAAVTAEAAAVDVRADARELVKKAKVTADVSLAMAARTKANAKFDADEVLAKAAKVKADADAKAAAVVEKETERIRKKGAEYFLNARGQIREERRLVREELRKEAEKINQMSAALQNNTAMRSINEMRGRIKNAEIAIKAGKFAEAEKQLQVAKDFAPRWKQKPKNDGMSLG